MVHMKQKAVHATKGSYLTTRHNKNSNDKVPVPARKCKENVNQCLAKSRIVKRCITVLLLAITLKGDW